MWVRGTAIRPVPPYARINEAAIELVRRNLSEEDDDTRTQLDDAFERFERRQPALASYIGDCLSEPLDETALALGYFLTLAVWLAFEQAHGEHVDEVSLDAVQATEELIELDEQLRRKDPTDAIDTDDVIAMEQPQLLEFVHDHIDGTLDAHADDVDVDDVDGIYRLVLVELLSLSYAVQEPRGYPMAKTEMLA